MVYNPLMRRLAKTGRVNARITDECDRLLRALAAKTGLSDAGIVELAIREYAEARGITPAPPADLAAQEKAQEGQ